MTRLRIILVICFTLAFSGGVFAGRLWERSEKHGPDGRLTELNLEPDQRTKIKEIWSEVMKKASWQVQREKREAAQKERDEAIAALILPEQSKRYEEIVRAAKEKQAAIAQESKKLMDDAYERTRALLNETQRAKYEELRQKRFDRNSSKTIPQKE